MVAMILLTFNYNFTAERVKGSQASNMSNTFLGNCGRAPVCRSCYFYAIDPTIDCDDDARRTGRHRTLSCSRSCTDGRPQGRLQPLPDATATQSPTTTVRGRSARCGREDTALRRRNGPAAATTAGSICTCPKRRRVRLGLFRSHMLCAR